MQGREVSLGDKRQSQHCLVAILELKSQGLSSGTPLGSRTGLAVAPVNMDAGASSGICLWCIFEDSLWNQVFQQDSAHIFKHKCVLNLPQKVPSKFTTSFLNSSQMKKKKNIYITSNTVYQIGNSGLTKNTVKQQIQAHTPNCRLLMWPDEL